MRSLEQLFVEYEHSHRNPVNVFIHYLCVPLIVFSTLGLMWAVPLGAWLGLPPEQAAWVNLATVFSAAAGVYYLRLSFGSLLVMALWFAASLVAILAIESAGWPLVWISAAVWLGAWAVQVYGHKVEGAKPSLVDDLVFLFIGPLFVTRKWVRSVARA